MHGLTKITFEHVLQSDVQLIIERWPVASRRLAHNLIQKYGMPHEATATMLIWNFNGPWKRTVLHQRGEPHNFPHPHIDLLEQTVEIKAQPELIKKVAEFDGSILINRTRGEMTAYCEDERANMLILNLAYDIAIGTKTPREAQDYMSVCKDPIYSSWPNPYEKELQFTSIVQPDNPEMRTQQPN